MESYLRLINRRLRYRSWRWSTKLQASALLGLALVLFGAVVAHALYLFVPPDYYIAYHGDLPTARSVSAAAVILLTLFGGACTHLSLQQYRFLAVRYNFVRALGRALR